MVLLAPLLQLHHIAHAALTVGLVLCLLVGHALDEALKRGAVVEKLVERRDAVHAVVRLLQLLVQLQGGQEVFLLQQEVGDVVGRQGGRHRSQEA
jgi:hypothetical protein